MRIALVSDCYPPRVGGIETQVRDLARQLATAGHAVEVLTATLGEGGAGRGTVEEDGGVRVHRLGEPALRGVPVNPFAVPRLRALLAGADVAHVHLGVISPFAWDGARVATRLGMPTVLTWHCLLDRAATPLRWSGAVGRWAERGARLTAVSTLAAEAVQAAAPGHAVGVLPNGIDPAAWAPAPSGDPAEDGPPRVVAALRLAPRKRPGVLLDVVGEARRRTGADLRLEVFGDGPLGPRLHRRSAGLPWVRWRGRVPRAELVAAYRGDAVYLAPTRLEAFGIAPLEARTAGLPVVARADSGTRDVVTHGESGLLAPDDAGLVDALVRLVEDPVLRGRIAAHNRAVTPPQVWGRVVPLVEAEYDRARGRRPTGPPGARRRAP